MMCGGKGSRCMTSLMRTSGVSMGNTRHLSVPFRHFGEPWTRVRRVRTCLDVV